MVTELSPENRRYIEELIQAGYYADESTALDEAVMLLRKRNDLRAEVLEGIQQADRGELLPADAVFARLEKRATEIEEAARGK